MPTTCCVPGCKELTGSFRFPKDPQVEKQWQVAIKREGPKKTLCKSSIDARVCERHFKSEDFSKFLSRVWQRSEESQGGFLSLTPSHPCSPMFSKYPSPPPAVLFDEVDQVSAVEVGHMFQEEVPETGMVCQTEEMGVDTECQTDMAGFIFFLDINIIYSKKGSSINKCLYCLHIV
jgi:hypothetical protein